MPIYEYICPRCLTKFDRLRPMSQAEEPTACPQGHPGARRMLSTFASFSKSASGETTPVACSGPSCSGCSATDCSTCL